MSVLMYFMDGPKEGVQLEWPKPEREMLFARPIHQTTIEVPTGVNELFAFVDVYEADWAVGRGGLEGASIVWYRYMGARRA